MRERKWGKDAAKKNAFLIREKEIRQKKMVLPFNNSEVNLFSFSSACTICPLLVVFDRCIKEIGVCMDNRRRQMM